RSDSPDRIEQITEKRQHLMELTNHLLNPESVNLDPSHLTISDEQIQDVYENEECNSNEVYNFQQQEKDADVEAIVASGTDVQSSQPLLVTPGTLSPITTTRSTQHQSQNQHYSPGESDESGSSSDSVLNDGERHQSQCLLFYNPQQHRVHAPPKRNENREQKSTKDNKFLKSISYQLKTLRKSVNVLIQTETTKQDINVEVEELVS
ncbi:unnamed protein product, partial [Didymodactylos carnosus]